MLLSIIDTLITDRTAADVTRWQTLRDKGYTNMTEAERAEWDAADMKGAYNVSDLNRVGEALNYLRDRLAAAHYLSGNEFTAKTNWVDNDIPTAVEFAAYLSYISVIREALAQFSTTPTTPGNSGSLNHQQANDIEQILTDVDKLITNMLMARYYCGELFAGEV